jgi:Zn-finger nucleic acid-binding protein
MQCPVDGNTLVITERSGVEIDYCPACRGVWLDRGELDKIIDRAAQAAPPAPVERGEYRPDYKKKKRGGFLEDIFDF